MSAMLRPHFISSNSWSIWWGKDDTTGSKDESGDLLLLSLLSPLSPFFSSFSHHLPPQLHRQRPLF